MPFFTVAVALVPKAIEYPASVLALSPIATDFSELVAAL